MIDLDLKRLLDHEIEMFGLELEPVLKVIQAFLDHCEASAVAQGDIPIATEANRDRFRSKNQLHIEVLGLLGGDSPEVVLVQLLRQPRVLKHALRRTLRAWESLHGEVNLEDLLVYSAIHTVSSRTIAFIRENHRILAYSGDNGDRGKEQAGIQDSWEAQMADVPADERQWLWVLLKNLFPALAMTGKDRLQGISRQPYWARIANGWFVDGEIRDQDVIKTVKRWKDTEDERQIIDRLMHDEQYAFVFERLSETPTTSSYGLTDDDILALASHLFEAMRREDMGQINKEECPGFFALWRLFIHRFAEVQDYESWLWSEMEKTMPVSLRLTNELDYFWASPRQVPSFDEKAAGRLWERRVEWAKENLTPGKLCRLLTGVPQNILRVFIRILPSDPQWERVAWIGPMLHESLAQCPLVIAPQVAMFISKVTQRVKKIGKNRTGSPALVAENIYTLVEEQVAGLFPGQGERETFIRQMLRPFEGEDQWSLDVAGHVGQVRRQLKDMIQGAESATTENDDGNSGQENANKGDGEEGD